MKRISFAPRDDWQKSLEVHGCEYHTIDGKPYWNEGAAYEFTAAEIDKIEEATNELHAMCMGLVQDVISHFDGTSFSPKYAGYGFPAEVGQVIVKSWIDKEPHLYGRFDLGYDGVQIKLFEYNADTPTALPEASVHQWHWLKDHGLPDQFNSIHEKLIARWPSMAPKGSRIYFTATSEGPHEDWGNVHYLMETASEAGFHTSSINLEEIGCNDIAAAPKFLDVNEREIAYCFKLYPWEWMMADEFGWNVRHSSTKWIEPAWKMLLSTKAILPLLWQRHPNHPLLLEAHFDDDCSLLSDNGDWVIKPKLGREGANISGVRGGKAFVTRDHNDKYDKHGYVRQRLMEPRAATWDKRVFPVIGSWVIGDEAAGIGIREDESFITTNNSRFVPHYFR